METKRENNSSIRRSIMNLEEACVFLRENNAYHCLSRHRHMQQKDIICMFKVSSGKQQRNISSCSQLQHIYVSERQTVLTHILRFYSDNCCESHCEYYSTGMCQDAQNDRKEGKCLRIRVDQVCDEGCILHRVMIIMRYFEH